MGEEVPPPFGRRTKTAVFVHMMLTRAKKYINTINYNRLNSLLKAILKKVDILIYKITSKVKSLYKFSSKKYVYWNFHWYFIHDFFGAELSQLLLYQLFWLLLIKTLQF
jgi:hypothetical protein